jgi:hypothetical protein
MKRLLFLSIILLACSQAAFGQVDTLHDWAYDGVSGVDGEVWVRPTAASLNLLESIHTVQRGSHDYKPGHGLQLKGTRSGYNLQGIIPTEAWYDPSIVGPLGSDGRDINKLGGVSTFSFFRPVSLAKNRNSALVGWRPADQVGFFEVYAYTNDRKGGFKADLLGTVEGYQFFTVRCDIQRRDRTVTYQLIELQAFVKHDLRAFVNQVNVGPWFGGNRTAPFKSYLIANQVSHE